ncbi:MAG TPA: hypothetical protein DDZ76_10985 [Xanthomonadales bacterium]|nr:hypothetical protein [Xanthomonadales bacterium]
MSDAEITLSTVVWRPSYRIVPSRFPPVGLFDAVADPADLEPVMALESLTNDRLREQLGHLRRLPPERRISGPGTTPIMSAFTHVRPDGSRFGNGRFGVYYATRDRATAIDETVFHRERFLRDAGHPPTDLQMRCYLADVRARLHDVRGGWPDLHRPDSYAAGQALAERLRAAGSDGIVYDSVRRVGGQCVALFYPDLIAPCRQSEHYIYRWNGSRIDQIVVASEAYSRP